MSYCYSCGSVLGVNDKFCNNCGAAAASQLVPQEYNPVPAQQDYGRKGALVEINRLIEYFGVKQAQYDEYDVCSENLSYLENPRAHVNVRGIIGGKPFIIIGAVLLGIGVNFGAIASSLNSGEMLGTCVLLSLFGAGSLAAGIVLTVTYNKKLRDTRNNLILQNQTRFNQLVDELSEYYKAYGYCPMSPEYTNPKILNKIRDIIWSGRADSIKEAINILHQDAHNSEMELQASLTARSAASAARGANTAAFFTAANFFLK